MGHDWQGFSAAHTEIELLPIGVTEGELGNPPAPETADTDTLVLGDRPDSTRCAIDGTRDELAEFAQRLARATTPRVRRVTMVPPRECDEPNMTFLNYFRDGVMAAVVAPWLPCEAVDALARLLRVYEWHHPAARWLLLHQEPYQDTSRKTACVDPTRHEELVRLPGVDLPVEDSADAALDEFLRVWTSATLAEQVAPEMGFSEISHVITMLEAHWRDASAWRIYLDRDQGN